MKRFTIVSVTFLLSTAYLSAQNNTVTPSSIPIHKFVVKGKTATKILSDLGKQYRIVIGVVGKGSFSSVDLPKAIDVKIKNGTLANVFDAVAAADQKFDWRQDGNGAVHFFQRGDSISLMNVTVHSFDYENPQWPEIIDRLKDIPEISGWLQADVCPMGKETIFLAGKPPAAWRKFSVHARDIPFSSILDQVAADSREYYWRVTEITEPNPCRVNIRWWL